MSITPRRRLLDIEGIELHWAEQGEGRPMVLLHGLCDSHRSWSRVASALAGSHRVLALDLPGHGLSGRPDASYALAWHAHVVGAWLEALGLEDVDLVGHSYGGGVAQQLLLEHRRRIRRLALVSSGGLGRGVGLGPRLLGLGGLVERFGQPFMGASTRLGLQLARADYSPEELEWASWVNSRAGTARAQARTAHDVIGMGGQRRHFLDRAHELSDLPPVALFWGDRDRVVPFEHGVETERLLDGATLTRFLGCGHFPHRECANDFTRALEGFIDASGARPARIRASIVRSRAARRPSWMRRAWQTCVRKVRAALAA